MARDRQTSANVSVSSDPRPRPIPPTSRSRSSGCLTSQDRADAPSDRRQPRDASSNEISFSYGLDRVSAVLGQLVERDPRQVAWFLGQPERALCDDVLLDLVSAAVDRQGLRAQRL